MNNVYKVENFLLPEELAIIDNILTNENMWAFRSERKNDKDLGRTIYTITIPESIHKNIKKRVENITGQNMPSDRGMSFTFADYSLEYGQPNLFPHFDGDNNDIIIDYQYKSNTSWGLGVNTTIFEMKDNDAIIFNPNEYPHWRPHKTFKDGEFISMIFFRFPMPGIDYSYLRYSRDHEIFEKANIARDSLS